MPLNKETQTDHSERRVCGVLIFFCNSRELLSGLVSPTTQILQARKQMEFDNNEH